MIDYTPAPWLSRGKSDSVHEVCNTHPYGTQIFRFHDDQGPSDADLSLILGAPVMYAALCKLRESLQQLNDCGDVGDYVAEELEIVRAALAEVEGDV